MPEDYPDFPSHRQMLDYFKAYAARFELLPKIALNTRVESAKLRDDGTWSVTVAGDGGQRTESFDALIVCSGHHREPLLPDYPGKFPAGRCIRANTSGRSRSRISACWSSAAAIRPATSPSTWRASPRPSPSACATAITSCLSDVRPSGRPALRPDAALSTLRAALRARRRCKVVRAFPIGTLGQIWSAEAFGPPDRHASDAQHLQSWPRCATAPCCRGAG